MSVSQGGHIDVESTQSDCLCDGVSVDGDCLKSFMEMSVTPAEFRTTGAQLVTSTPIMGLIGNEVNYDRGIFSISRVKKVDLQDLSPKVSEFNCE